MTSNPLPKADESRAAAPHQFGWLSLKNVTNLCSAFNKSNFFKVLMSM
jgi:hypothetical protein